MGGLRLSQRRGLAAMIAAWSSVVARALIGLGLAVGGLISAAVGVIFGVGLADPEGLEIRQLALFFLRLGLLILLLFVLVLPLLRSAQGGAMPRQRLLLLPISFRRLHFAELTSGISDPLLLLALPALITLPLTLTVLLPGNAVPVWLGSLLLLAVLLGLIAVVSFGSALLLRNRRRAEAVVLVFALFITSVSLLPVLLDRSGDRAQDEAAVSADGSADQDRLSGQGMLALVARTSGFSVWLQPLPSEAYSRLVALSLDGGDPRAISLPLLLLAITGGGLYWSSWSLWRRIVASPSSESRSSSESGPRSSAPTSWRPARLPGLSPAAAAVARSHLRTTTRSLAGRLAFAMPTLMVVMLSIAVDLAMLSRLPIGSPALTFGLGAIGIALLSQQPLLLNQFAIDGAGLSLQFLAPIDSRDLVIGKAAAGGLLFGAACVPALLVSALLADLRGGLLVTALLIAATSYLLFAPVACALSILLPRPVDLSRMGRQAQAHDFAVLLGFVAIGVILSMVTTMTVAVPLILGRPGLAPLCGILVLTAAGLVAVPLLRAEAALLSRRSDALLLTVRER